ncbi:MAG TPA: pyridoxal-phosphate dependent enzyme [Bacteroidia bacterium]|nr:pyridoxal-phosphate dependent enzyme [Bacteroidia bacterium]
MITANDLLAAQARIAPFIHCTPVLTSTLINAAVGAELYFKCENLQKIGAFKIRGATNALRSMSADELRGGACTHSSGNHAQAVAYAARALGIPAYIVMPSTSSAVKKAAVAAYGAKIYECEPNQAAREAMAAQVMQDTGAAFVHPYDDDRIIAGQGTAAMELIQDQPGLDHVLAPIGGGGLMGGTALAVAYFSPGSKAIACEPDGADDAFRSFRDRVPYPSQNPKTLADGLLTSVGERNREILFSHVDQVVTCSEQAMVQAMRLVWERMKIVIEPSSAVPLACLLEGKLDVRGKRVGIIVSGGNVDLSRLPF